MKSQKGITLIALVITIIVMLILVAVTITIAVNGGLFDYAKNASEKTNEAMANEQKLGTGEAKLNVSGTETPASINSIVTYYTTSTDNYQLTTAH